MKTAAQETCERMVTPTKQSVATVNEAHVAAGNALFRQNNKQEASLWYQRVPLSLHLIFHLIRMIKEGNGLCVRSHQWQEQAASGDLSASLMVAMMQASGKGMTANSAGAQTIATLAAKTDFLKEEQALCKFAQAWNYSQVQGNVNQAKTFFQQAVQQLGSVDFPMVDSNSLGILAFCTAIFGSNATGNSAIPTATCPSAGSGAANYCFYGCTSNGWYSSSSSSYAIITFDFGQHKVSPTGYMIQMYSWGWKSWTVDGSADQSNWDRLDTRSGESIMTAGNQCYGFSIKRQPKSHRFIKFQFTEANNSGNWQLSSYAMEIYGTLS
jgi:hypothetical protein